MKKSKNKNLDSLFQGRRKVRNDFKNGIFPLLLIDCTRSPSELDLRFKILTTKQNGSSLKQNQ